MQLFLHCLRRRLHACLRYVSTQQRWERGAGGGVREGDQCSRFDTLAVVDLLHTLVQPQERWPPCLQSAPPGRGKE